MLKAKSDYVIVKVAMPEEKTASGLFLAVDKKERLYEGEIVSTGDSPEIIKQGLKAGDYVYYNKGVNYEFCKDDVLYDGVSVYDVIAKKED